MEISNQQIINKAIIEFFRTKPYSNLQFHGYELLNFAISRGARPHTYMDTVLRAMRQLKADGVIQYNQIGSPSKSLYEVVVAI